MQAPHSASLEPARAQRGQDDVIDGSSRSHAAHSGRSPLGAWHRRQSCASRVCLILLPMLIKGRNEIDKWKCFPEDALVVFERVTTNRMVVKFAPPALREPRRSRS